MTSRHEITRAINNTLQNTADKEMSKEAKLAIADQISRNKSFISAYIPAMAEYNQKLLPATTKRVEALESQLASAHQLLGDISHRHADLKRRYKRDAMADEDREYAKTLY